MIHSITNKPVAVYSLFRLMLIPVLFVCFYVSLPLVHAGEEEAVSTSSAAQLALEETRASLRLQTDFPQIAEPTRETRRQNGASGSPLGEFSDILLVAAIILFCLILLTTFFSNAMVRPSEKRGQGKKRVNQPDEAAQARMRVAREEADVYAAAGSYAEAMHVLLLQALAEMRRRLNEPMARSLTSREILQRTGLRSEARGALARIIEGVELTYFGQRVPAKADYEACRGLYEQFTEALRMGDA